MNMKSKLGHSRMSSERLTQPTEQVEWQHILCPNIRLKWYKIILKTKISDLIDNFQ